MAEIKEWQLQDAKNRFSEVVRLAQSAPQSVTVHGKPSVIVIAHGLYSSHLNVSVHFLSLLAIIRIARLSLLRDIECIPISHDK